MKGTEAADMAGASMGATSDNAPWQGCVVGQHSKVNGGNSDTKTAATAIASLVQRGMSLEPGAGFH